MTGRGESKRPSIERAKQMREVAVLTKTSSLGSAQSSGESSTHRFGSGWALSERRRAGSGGLAGAGRFFTVWWPRSAAARGTGSLARWNTSAALLAWRRSITWGDMGSSGAWPALRWRITESRVPEKRHDRRP